MSDIWAVGYSYCFLAITTLLDSLPILSAKVMDQDYGMIPSVTTEDILTYYEEYPVPPWSITAERIVKTILRHLIGENRTTCSYKDDEYLTPREVCLTWPVSDRRNVINFMHASSSFAESGREMLKELLHPSRAGQDCTLLKLPTEVFTCICEFLSPRQQDLLPLWKFRASLSVESFATLPPPPPPNQNLEHIANFRATCQRFAQAGLVNQFRDVHIRFSSKSFETLLNLSSTEHIVRETTRIAYMVPRFYGKDRDEFEELLRICDQSSQDASEDNETRPATNAQPSIVGRYRKHIFNAMKKADAQGQIIRDGIDSHALLQALIKFRNLKQIRIMRVEDGIDAGWVSFLKGNPSYAGNLMVSEWVAASDHAVSTLHAALEQSNSPAHRLSSRFVDPSIALVLFTLSQNENLSEWARQLTSLELQLVKDLDPDIKIVQLSPQFRALFRAALNLEAFHVGSYHQISVPLESIFHGAHLRNLQHLGLHFWLLDVEELMDFLAQHQSTIRSLRLRKVVLRRTSEDDPKWLKVLRFIRMNLTRLNWISLRDVNYEGAIPDYPEPIPLPAVGTIYDSETDTEVSSDDIGESADDTDDEDARQTPTQLQAMHSADDTSSIDGASSLSENNDHVVGDEDYESSVEPEFAEVDEGDIHSDLDEDHGNERKSQYTTRCQCGNGFAWDDLVDNGVSVSRKQWKMWQIWTANRCLMHDPSSNTSTP
ncbi:hypothetical protein BKA61DRAFT_240073 [Leptodontidium sp. MPI-SDFR-AT-0119]|nr:hypothetical protein BKA61DRAFT_240073 [Leptodontidium sp. MPI-SDFR-AT-0119]